MKPVLILVVTATLAVAAGLAGGYLLARSGAIDRWFASIETAAPGPAPEATPRAVLYYRDPTGKPDYSPTPKQDEAGRDFLPVYEDEEEPLAPPPPAQPSTADERPGRGRILYYRNPMGLPDTSPVPKKDPMGMEYIPVYENEADDGPVVSVDPRRIQILGVRTEAVTRRTLVQSIRAAGTMQFDERRISVVSAKFDGWIEDLLVNATGEAVRRGQPLMRVYSPDLLLAQQEYAALRAAMPDPLPDAGEAGPDAGRRLLEGALQRLRFLDVPDDVLRTLQQGGAPQRTVLLRSPVAGVVIDKAAVEGMRFMPGDPLYRIVDLSQMWLIADVFEQDLAMIAVGQPAVASVRAYPDRRFFGRVAFLYPTMSGETRTARIRIELANPDGLLKEQMYATVEIAAPAGRPEVLAVPDSAVIDTGVRQVVLIERGEGRFEPRPVRMGVRGDSFVEVLDGVREGERVVTGANFLIDAESNLRAALQAFGAGPPNSQPPAPPLAGEHRH